MSNWMGDILVVINFIIVFAISGGISQYQSSPCPRIFSYQYNQQRGLYGVIRIVNNHNSRLQLNVEMSVGNRVQGYNGNIELSKPKEEVIQDIVNYRPILYKVFFPVWRRIPPQITKISLNGDLLCKGPNIERNLVPIITTINLQHTMKVDVFPLSYPNGPDGNNILYPEDDSPRVKFQEFDSPHEYGDNFRLSRTGPSPDRPPPVRSSLDFNSGRPIHLPNDGREQFLKTYQRDVNRPDGVRKEQERVLQLNPENPFLFHSTKGHSKENTSPGFESPIFPGNPFFLPSLEVSKTEPNLKTTESTLDISTSSLFQRNTVKTNNPSGNEDGLDSSESSIPYGNICGKSVSTNALVLHGNKVPRGGYPWLVALFRVKPTGLNYVCSGSLISDRHIVTAAHCTKKEGKVLQPKELLAILGKLNIQKWVPSEGEKFIEPESIHVHPDYKEFSSDADVAILVLSEKMEFNIFVRPLCLWNGNSELEQIVGKQGTVVGWGKDENGNLMTEEPRQIQLPIVNQETCLRSSYQFQYITSNRTFCAGFRNGTGPCNGDSGSGFIIQHQGRWMLRGIVSTSISDNGARTCDLKNYVVFTDASKFNDWIFSFIK